MSTCHHDVPCVKRIVGTEVFLRLSSGILERRLHSNVTFTEDEEGSAAEACANLCYVCFDSFVSLCLFPSLENLGNLSSKWEMLELQVRSSKTNLKIFEAQGSHVVRSW